MTPWTRVSEMRGTQRAYRAPLRMMLFVGATASSLEKTTATWSRATRSSMLRLTATSAPGPAWILLARTLDLHVMFGCMIESSIACTAAAQLGPLADHMDIDGPLLIKDDPYRGVEYSRGAVRLPGGPGLGVEKRVKGAAALR